MKYQLGCFGEYQVVKNLSETFRLPFNTQEFNTNQTSSEYFRVIAGAKLISEEIIKDIDFIPTKISYCNDYDRASKPDIILQKKDFCYPCSIKIYKNPQLNLSNSTYLSFFKGLFFDSINEKSVDFVERTCTYKNEFKELLRHQNYISDNIKLGKDKHLLRQEQKSMNKETIGIISFLFNELYKECPDKINRKIKYMLGMKNCHLYANVGTNVITTNNNDELRTLKKNLLKPFHMSLDQKNNSTMGELILSNSREVFKKFDITLTDTGGKFPQGKINIWCNLRNS